MYKMLQKYKSINVTIGNLCVLTLKVPREQNSIKLNEMTKIFLCARLFCRIISYPKVSFFVQFTKTQLITFQNNIQTCFSQFLWFFSLKSWFKGPIISRIHLSPPNAYKLMCFDRNIIGNRDVKFLIGIIGHCTDGRISL